MIIDQGEQDILNIGSEGIASALPFKDDMNEIQIKLSLWLVRASTKIIFSSLCIVRKVWSSCLKSMEGESCAR